MTPLPPGALEHLLKTLPPERNDPFAHLQDLTPTQLLQRRLEITQEAKYLEQERHRIDEELQEIHSEAELRFGLWVSDDWLLRQKSRTTWEYSPEVQEVVQAIQKEAQRDGRAVSRQTFFLSFTKSGS
jgi:hypothetical protein